MDGDQTGERAAEGQSPTMPDRAEEKRVDVPQNEEPVQDSPTQTDGPAQTQETSVTETPTIDGGTPDQATDGPSEEE